MEYKKWITLGNYFIKNPCTDIICPICNQNKIEKVVHISYILHKINISLECKFCNKNTQILITKNPMYKLILKKLTNNKCLIKIIEIDK